MFSVSETITRSLTPSERLSLDNQQVFDVYCKAMVEMDKSTAIECAKTFMLKALSVSN